MVRRKGGTNLLFALSLAILILDSTLALDESSRSSDEPEIKNTTEVSRVDGASIARNKIARENPEVPTTGGRKDAIWERNPIVGMNPSKSFPTRSVKVPSGKDSYLEALKHSRINEDPHERVVRTDANRREYTQGPIYSPQLEYGTSKEPQQTSYGTAKPSGGTYRDVFSIGQSDSYSLPTRTSVDFKEHSGPPGNSYGPPRISFPDSPPRSTYGPPSKSHGPNSYGEFSGGSYLPPQPVYGYGPPHGLEVSHTPFQLPSLPSIDFSLPFALKLNAFTLAKILLKLVIFKMIVKFIAVICLLLFIPKLEIVKKGSSNNNADDEDESRHFVAGNTPTMDLDALTSLVTGSFEKYELLNSTKSRSNEQCESLGCHLRRFLIPGESWQDYTRLFGNYVLEETRSTEIAS